MILKGKYDTRNKTQKKKKKTTTERNGLYPPIVMIHEDY